MRLLGMLSVLVVVFLCLSGASFAEEPGWVEDGGSVDQVSSVSEPVEGLAGSDVGSEGLSASEPSAPETSDALAASAAVTGLSPSLKAQAALASESTTATAAPWTKTLAVSTATRVATRYLVPGVGEAVALYDIATVFRFSASDVARVADDGEQLRQQLGGLLDLPGDDEDEGATPEQVPESEIDAPEVRVDPVVELDLPEDIGQMPGFQLADTVAEPLLPGIYNPDQPETDKPDSEWTVPDAPSESETPNLQVGESPPNVVESSSDPVEGSEPVASPEQPQPDLPSPESEPSPATEDGSTATTEATPPSPSVTADELVALARDGKPGFEIAEDPRVVALTPSERQALAANLWQRFMAGDDNAFAAHAAIASPASVVVGKKTLTPTSLSFELEVAIRDGERAVKALLARHGNEIMQDPRLREVVVTQLQKTDSPTFTIRSGFGYYIKDASGSYWFIPDRQPLDHPDIEESELGGTFGLPGARGFDVHTGGK